jgi:hypothetical protein
MVCQPKLLPAFALGLLVLLSASIIAAEATPQNSTAAARATLRFQEAQSLRQVYLTLAAGNHDYDGHRAKTMGAVRSALKTLDGAVLKNGTAQQKSATAQGQAAVAKAEAAAKQTPTLHENQASSDKLLQQAAQLLNQVRATMVTNKQKPKVLAHVDTAIAEIATALKIR